MGEAITEMALPGLTPFQRGKVRDSYMLGDDLLLFVTTDRVSAFDVVLPVGVPDKGRVLTGLAAFWFGRTRELVPNHLVSTDVGDLPPSLAAQRDALAGRIMIGRRARRVDIECVARGYLAGTMWAEYRRTGDYQGFGLPPASRRASNCRARCSPPRSRTTRATTRTSPPRNWWNSSAHRSPASWSDAR